MQKRALLRRGVAALLMTLQLAGCTYWRLESLPPTAVIERQQPDVIRLQHGAGRRQLLYAPVIRGDSVIGGRSYDSRRQDGAVALAGVTGLETHHVSPGRTAALVMGIGAVAFVAAIIGLSRMQGTFDNWGQ